MASTSAPRRDPATQAEAVVAWHNFGYGSVHGDAASGNGTGAWEACEDGQAGPGLGRIITLYYCSSNS